MARARKSPHRTLILLLALVAAWLLPRTGAAAPKGQPVTFTSSDGVRLSATWYPAKQARSGAVLYLHMPARSGKDWRYLAAMVAERGLPGLALDFRGHGDSRQTEAGESLDRDTFTAEDWRAMLNDVAAAVDWLRRVRKVDAKGIRIVGADVGGSLGLLHAVSDPAIHSVALLSPGLGYKQLNVKGQVAAYGDRPLLMVLSEEDSYSVKSVDVLAEEARGRLIVQRYVGAGHGTKMLNREGGLEQLILAWLLGTLGDDGRPGVPNATVDAQEKSVEGTSGRDLTAEERRRIKEQQRQVQKDQKAIEKEQAPVDAGDEPRRWE